MTNLQLAERLAELGHYSEPWFVELEPHNYPDGTTHFTHVKYLTDGLSVEVASYVTPELGELLVLLYNNLKAIIGALRND